MPAAVTGGLSDAGVMIAAGFIGVFIAHGPLLCAKCPALYLDLRPLRVPGSSVLSAHRRITHAHRSE